MATVGKKYIFVVVNYFKKWTEEAEVMKNMIGKRGVKCVFQNIVCQFSICLQIMEHNLCAKR